MIYRGVLWPYDKNVHSSIEELNDIHYIDDMLCFQLTDNPFLRLSGMRDCWKKRGFTGMNVFENQEMPRSCFFLLILFDFPSCHSSMHQILHNSYHPTLPKVTLLSVLWKLLKY